MAFYNGVPGYNASVLYGGSYPYDSVGYDSPIGYDADAFYDGVPGYNAAIGYNGVVVEEPVLHSTTRAESGVGVGVSGDAGRGYIRRNNAWVRGIKAARAGAKLYGFGVSVRNGTNLNIAKGGQASIFCIETTSRTSSASDSPSCPCFSYTYEAVSTKGVSMTSSSSTAQTYHIGVEHVAADELVALLGVFHDY